MTCKLKRMGSLYQSNIAEAYGSTDTGLAKFAMQNRLEYLQQPCDGASRKVAYTKLETSESGVVKVVNNNQPQLESHGSTRSLFTRRLVSKLSSVGYRGATPSLLSIKKASDSIDSGTDVKSPDDQDGPNFDLLFESPDRYPLGLRTPKCLSPSGTVDDITTIDIDGSRWDIAYLGRSDSDDTTSYKRQYSRRSSVMETTFTQLVAKHYHTSGGLAGFRRRMANDINEKYCSFCRCDDVVFLFLYVIFGIVYISAGTLGLMHCSSEQTVAYYLLADGFLSVFVFPITIVEWTRRIGGCLNEEEKLDRGVLFIVIVLMRVVAAVAGTVILILREQKPPENEFFCHVIHILLEVGVVMEWAFLVLVILLPLCLYCCGYLVAICCL